MNKGNKSPIDKLLRLFTRFEYLTSIFLSILIAGILLVATIRIAYFTYTMIFSNILSPATIVYADFNDLFGKIITLLIIIEFMNSILSVLKTRDLKRLVQDVTLITGLAIARKLIIFDYTDSDHMTIIAMGVMLIAVGVFYFLIRIDTVLKYLRNKNSNKGVEPE